MLRALLLVPLLAASTALAGDDCTLSDEVLRPQLDSKRLPRGAKVTAQKRKARLHRETLVFADGLEATLQVGGCSHLGFSVELTSKKQVTAALTPAEAVALVKKVLPTLPVSEKATLQPKTFLEALGRLTSAPTAFPVSLDCGEFTTCELSLDVSGKKPTLLIGYDFPL